MPMTTLHIRTDSEIQEKTQQPVRPPIQYDCWKGRYTVPDDFDAPLEDFTEYMQ